MAKHIVSFAGRITWNALLQAGLLQAGLLQAGLLQAGLVQAGLVVGATGLGEGVPIFTEPVGGLVPAEVRRLDGSGNVLLRYAVSAG